MSESLSKVRGAPQPERYVASGETQGSAPAQQSQKGADLTLSGPSSSPHHPLHRGRLAMPHSSAPGCAPGAGDRARDIFRHPPQKLPQRDSGAWHRAAGAEGRARALTRAGRPGVGPPRGSWMAARLRATAPRVAPGHLPQCPARDREAADPRCFRAGAAATAGAGQHRQAEGARRRGRCPL